MPKIHVLVIRWDFPPNFCGLIVLLDILPLLLSKGVLVPVCRTWWNPSPLMRSWNQLWGCTWEPLSCLLCLLARAGHDQSRSKGMGLGPQWWAQYRHRTFSELFCFKTMAWMPLTKYKDVLSFSSCVLGDCSTSVEILVEFAVFFILIFTTIIKSQMFSHNICCVTIVASQGFWELQPVPEKSFLDSGWHFGRVWW